MSSFKNIRGWQVDVELCNYLGTRYVNQDAVVQPQKEDNNISLVVRETSV